MQPGGGQSLLVRVSFLVGFYNQCFHLTVCLFGICLFPTPCPHPARACPGRPPRSQPGPAGRSPAPLPPKGGEGGKVPPSIKSLFHRRFASLWRGRGWKRSFVPRQPPAALLRGKMLRSRHPLRPPRESGERPSVGSAALSGARGEISPALRPAVLLPQGGGAWDRPPSPAARQPQNPPGPAPPAGGCVSAARPPAPLRGRSEAIAVPGGFP